jgi:penicillin-binding protein 2
MIEPGLRRGEHLERLAERTRALSISAALLFLVVAGGYWYLQIVQGAHYRQQSENNRLRKAPIQAPRGLIVDRYGRSLVENIPSYNLLLDRSQSPDLQESLHFAATVLDRDHADLQEVMARYRETPGFVPVLVAEDLDLQEVARFEVATLEHPEFQIQVLQRRLYRHGAHTAHLLGYLGEVGPEELARAGTEEELEAGDLRGKEGVEEAYDRVLRGRDGEQVLIVDSRGKLVDQLRVEPARSGQEVELTLDLELQQEAVHLMAGRVGAVVALDPRNGEIRAMTSSPSYDPNRFARRLRRQEWYDILSSPHQSLQNRVIHNTYAPGSVFKIVMAIAGLSEGASTLDEPVWCNGQTRLHNRRWRCWRRGGHGRVDLHDALKYSCDVFFYHLGQELGVDTIATYARRLGLGRATGVDIAGERTGLVPDSAWSLDRRGTPWYPGETISVAIGQGPLLVTPLQIAVLVAAVANGGSIVVPHLRSSEEPGSTSTGVRPAVLATVRRALLAVVNDAGSGASARLRDVEVAGKTGTAQVIRQHTWTQSQDLPEEYRDHSWFAAYAPAEAAELVVVVFVEHGGLGSQAAAPVARALYEKYFESRDHPAGTT